MGKSHMLSLLSHQTMCQIQTNSKTGFFPEGLGIQPPFLSSLKLPLTLTLERGTALHWAGYRVR